MEIIKPGINIDFIGRRKIGYIISLVLIAASILTLVVNGGPNYGIDFAGGTIVQVRFDASVDINDIRTGLDASGLSGVSIQAFDDEDGKEFLLRTPEVLATGDEFATEMTAQLAGATGVTAEIRRIEMVGPQVGETLREGALFAMFYALLFITIYISGRFEMKWMVSGVTAGVLISGVVFFSRLQLSIPLLILIAIILTLVLFWQLRLRYAMGAIVALLHDVTITVGIFTLLGKEFSLPVIAALLTIIGYSLNDTIVVFDRIRENLRLYSTRILEKNINNSINETLSRTLLTSSTTLLVLLSLFFLGGDIIHDFAFTLIIGVIVGTYSSLFVASPMLLVLQGTMPPPEDEDGYEPVKTETGTATAA
ncbi:MAG: protein translocase subunit SecF [Thermodesulfobacteriota bacterium]